MSNLFQDLPAINVEITQVLLQLDAVKIERIVSNGQPSPADFWYDQEQDEWVLLVQGTATLESKSGAKKEMRAGDYFFIPCHLKHRISEVSQDAVWLAIHSRCDGKCPSLNQFQKTLESRA